MEEKKAKKFKLNLDYRIWNDNEVHIGKMVYCKDYRIEIQCGSDFKTFSTYFNAWRILLIPLEEGIL